ncbi:MAG: hypothetical protein N5P05_001021 [Chroococcopsis gigantea SAG 12.99]|nr:CHAT domain-containing protein [Chlorogloea purpurea SAG 13.99]MDV2999415.1 hypothetical protein [Chroococcopsis gigantea SAG 12.99]
MFSTAIFRLACPLAVLSFLSLIPVNETSIFTVQKTYAQDASSLKSSADQLERQGIQLLQAGQLESALAAWQQALNIYRQLGDKYQEGRLLSNFGSLFLQLKQYAQAVQALESSVSLLKNSQNQELLQSTVLNLAQAYTELKNYTSAINYYQQGLALARQANDTAGQIQALGNIGTIYYDLKNYSAAATVFQQVVIIAQKTNNPKILATGLKYLGDSYYLLGNCQYAEAFYEWGNETAKSLNDPQRQLGFLQNRGNAAYCQGKFQIALDSYEKGLEIAKGLNSEDSVAELIGNIGLVQVHLGNYAVAIDYLQQDLAVQRKLGRRQAEGQALGSLGDAYYYQENYQQALSYYQQSLQIAQEVNYARGVGLMLTNVGAAQLKLNQLPDAEKNLRESIRVLLALREKGASRQDDELSLFDREVRSYRILQQVLVKSERPESALEIAEAGRARIFVEFLAKKNTQQKVDSLSLAEIKKIAVDKQITLIEYSVVYDKEEAKNKDGKLYIWVVLPDGKINFKQVDLAGEGINLSQLINDSRSAIGVGGRGLAIRGTGAANQQESLEKLYKLLISPIAASLPSDPNAKIVFIPHEELFLVPFPALSSGGNNYLIRDHTILGAPSIQVLQLLGNTPKRDYKLESALVVGNPTMPSLLSGPGSKPEQLPPLPGAEQEARSIANLLNTQAILGAQASKANILPKMQNSDIVHLATHGLLDVDADGTLNTRYAGYRVGGAIALAPQGQDKGLLTVDEIINLKLKADLVVLSACDTAAGKIVGDGVIGLSRSFLAAGAKNVMVSLWAVPDAPTSQLMTQFYSGLAKNPDKGQALRQAMLATMKDHPAPKDWAAFTLIGQ